jgi:hypothetical protein
MMTNSSYARALNDPDFMRIASQKIPSLDTLHHEFDAAKAERLDQAPW